MDAPIHRLARVLRQRSADTFLCAFDIHSFRFALAALVLLRRNAEEALELLAEIVWIVETAQLGNGLNLKARCQ